jgi:hypothetical protein
MNEIRICDLDSDRVVLEAIMEGVNGLIRAKNEESAPSASTNTGSPKLPTGILESFKRQSDVFKGVTHIPSFIAGATAYHDFICRQLRAGA